MSCKRLISCVRLIHLAFMNALHAQTFHRTRILLMAYKIRFQTVQYWGQSIHFICIDAYSSPPVTDHASWVPAQISIPESPTDVSPTCFAHTPSGGLPSGMISEEEEYDDDEEEDTFDEKMPLGLIETPMDQDEQTASSSLSSSRDPNSYCPSIVSQLLPPSIISTSNE